MSLSVGGVLEIVRVGWSKDPIRIIAFDDIEVLYESWWPEAKSWGFTSLAKFTTYYRYKTDCALENSKFLRVEPLTDEEFSVHRPDLPLRLLRSTQTFWSNEDYPDPDALVASLKKPPSDIDLASNGIVLNIPQVALTPVGPKGALKKPVVIEAQDSVGFTARELFWYANRLQAPLVKHEDLQEGIGLYRAGIVKKMPLFYLWGALDRARFCDPLPGYRSSRAGLFWERVE